MAARVLKAKLWPDETNAKTSVCCPAARKEIHLTFPVETECSGYRRRSPMWFVNSRLPSNTQALTDLVSQFTLYGHIKKGNKPDFHAAADVETARRLYDRFVKKVSDLYKAERVKNGVFQAMMEVELKNDGPVGVDFRSEDGAVGQSCVLLPVRLFIFTGK